jgi:membrane associated rhomboid family serine protease
MLKSVYQDVKEAFISGNMIVRIIIINVALYMVLALTQALFPGFFNAVFPYIALPGNVVELVYKPWTLFTHMFSHTGFFHMAWNMLILYWFGNIVGDLIGDKRIAPLYFLGGLTGAVLYIISFYLLPTVAPRAIGASAAVLSIVFAAVAVAPDYRVHLLLLGPVKIKFIGLFILFFDLLGAASQVNAGGHIGHLGGTLFGFAFVYLLRKGVDLSDWKSIFPVKTPPKHRKLRVEYKAPELHRTKIQPKKITPLEEEIDRILEKIKQQGYENLTGEEKDTLHKASKE